jgi:hypothetical protein
MMAGEKQKGLLAIWTDVDPDFRIEFQKWHNCEHITDRITLPGFFVGRRYQGTGDAPTFLMCYETDDAKVLASEPYLHAVNNPSPWSKKVIPRSKNLVRAIYTLLFSEGAKPPTEAPFLLLMKFNMDAGREEKILQWVQEEWLPKLCKIPGVYRGRLYRVDENVSLIQTAERKIHGGGPGQQKYLGFFETASLDVAETDAWQALQKEAGLKNEKNDKIWDVHDQSYWLDFVMYSPR